ncbi:MULTISPECIES: MFS transporter [Priestia]|uniref:MFS transporter n=1 Tax=Priestia TaxID=2800373 RepID=UPI00203FDC66|nr:MULTISPECIES: MFS transporter [Priestia]MCM3771392.1 MFS transporter [Priestia aryabhattai]MDY0943838.1 MFS transporter [Priestia megaterium]
MILYLIVTLFLIYQISIRGNTVLVTLYALDLHASAVYLGGIVAATSLFPMLFAAYAGRFSDRIGYRLPLGIGAIGTGIALLLPYMFTNQLLILVISQSLLGLFQIFTIVSMQNLIGALSNKENRSYYFSTFSLGVAISNFLGPLITGLSIDHLHFDLTYLILALFSIFPGFFFLFNWIKLPKAIIKVKEQENKFVELLVKRSLRKTFIISGIILTGVGMYEFYFPVYAKHIGLSASIIGIILSSNAIAYILSRLLMQPLVSKFKEETVLGACLSISAVAFFLLPLFSDYIFLMIISFIMGLGLGCCQPLSIVMAYSHSPKGRTGEVLGIRLTVNKCVQFLVPIVFGYFGSILGFFPVFWSNAILLLYSGYSLFEKTPSQNSNSLNN